MLDGKREKRLIDSFNNQYSDHREASFAWRVIFILRYLLLHVLRNLPYLPSRGAYRNDVSRLHPSCMSMIVVLRILPLMSISDGSDTRCSL